MIYIDFETRSRCNLIERGAYNYAADLSTDIICCGFYDPDTKHQQVWYSTDPFPERLQHLVERADYVVAHNAEFDMNIWELVGVNDYGLPEIPREKWYCSSAQCRVNALPASLDDAAWALGLKTRKMASGKDLIKKLSIPQADGAFNKDPDLIKQMGDYCMQDVIVMAALVNATRLMTEDEHQDWLKTVEVNERGVKIDSELAGLALKYAEVEKSEIAEQLSELTDGTVTKHTQSARVREWVLCHQPDLKEYMVVHKDGKEKLSLDKNIRRNILTDIENGDKIIYPKVKKVIELFDDGNKSSVAKFKRMINLADEEDGRVRGAFMFAGASQTLRYTSRGLQLHNMRRDCFDAEETEVLKGLMREAHDLSLSGGVMDSLSKLLRPAIIPDDGKVLIVGDWSAIEARVLPWLSDTDGGDAKLEVFKQGKDIYVETAVGMGMPPEARQEGKVAELACGYQGGTGAFQAFANIYGLTISDAQAQMYVDSWRSANQWAVQFWAELQSAAMSAVSHPHKIYSAGMVDYKYLPELMGGTLLCIMPNNTIIQYPKVRVEDGRYGWELTSLKASFKPKADEKTWPRTKLYGGLLAENCTQAFAASILRNCLRDLPDVIASVHDEIVLEVPRETADERLADLERRMNTTPEWAEGLPLIAKPEIFERYGK